MPIVWIQQYTNHLTDFTAMNEVGRFVHIDPDSVEVNIILQNLEMFGPPKIRVQGSEIGENSVPGPDNAHNWISLVILDENV